MGTFFQKKPEVTESGDILAPDNQSVALFMGEKLYSLLEKTMQDTRVACANREYTTWVSLLRQMHSWTLSFSKLNDKDSEEFTKKFNILIIKAQNVQRSIVSSIYSGTPMSRKMLNNEDSLRQEIHTFEDHFYSSIKHMLMKESQGDIIDDMQSIITGE